MMHPLAIGRAALALAAAGLSACAARSSPPASIPTASATSADAPRRFPAMPRVIGKLDVRVVYPPPGARIAARDSTFLFGSVGRGDARLFINGAEVDIYPNGSWLAWLPVPTSDRPVYDLVATQGVDTLRLAHRVVIPPRPLVLREDGPLMVDSGSVAPGGLVTRLPTEAIRLSVRAPRNAAVTLLVAGGERRPLRHLASLGTGSVADPALWATDVEARLLDGRARLEIARGYDTVTLAAPRIARADSVGPRYAILGDPAASPDSGRVIVARPIPGGTYKWFFLPGTVVEVTGRSDGAARLRLDDALDVWVDAAELRELPPGTPAPRRIAANARVVGAPGGWGEWSDVVIPMAERPAWMVDEGERALVLTLYGTTANTDIVHYAAADSVVQRVTWEQVENGRVRYTIALREPPFGYLARWERGALVLRVRRAPRIDPTRPLAGLTIAVDAGHPPAGSTGPTGLYEAVATLPISLRLKRLLEGQGASVVMTRTSPGALGLAERPAIARRANAHALVSIHLNALPDGVNPFTAHGTGTYYFNPSSEPLARQVQAGMVRRMGLRDLGINYDNLAVIRPTWMPSVLCEGAFIMLPEQEALLRTEEFQEAYAQGVADGLVAYFAERGKGSQGRRD